MNLLRPLEHCGRGFESHSRYGCLSTFILYLCCPIYVAALRQSWSLAQGVVPTVCKIKKLKWNEAEWMNDWNNIQTRAQLQTQTHTGDNERTVLVFTENLFRLSFALKLKSPHDILVQIPSIHLQSCYHLGTESYLWDLATTGLCQYENVWVIRVLLHLCNDLCS
jgi:hypothetical protein